MIAVGTDRQFAALCEVVGGEPSSRRTRRFVNNAARVEHRDQLREALEQRLATRSAREWAAR